MIVETLVQYNLLVHSPKKKKIYIFSTNFIDIQKINFFPRFTTKSLFLVQNFEIQNTF